MFLADTGTENLARWKGLKDEANERVRRVLKSFVASHLAHAPGATEFLGCARDALYAYFQAAQCFFYDQLEIMLAPYQERLVALTAPGYLSLLGTLHMTHLVFVHVSRHRPAAEASWFNLLTAGAAAMYGRPEGYVADWRARLDGFSDAQHGPARIVCKAYEEIAAVVGAPPYRMPVFERLFWSDIQFCIAERAKALYAVADWRQVVDAELADPEGVPATSGREL